MIDDQNMKRKKYRTDQDEQFAPSDGEALTWCQAEKIQAFIRHMCDNDAD